MVVQLVQHFSPNKLELKKNPLNFRLKHLSQNTVKVYYDIFCKIGWYFKICEPTIQKFVLLAVKLSVTCKLKCKFSVLYSACGTRFDVHILCQSRRDVETGRDLPVCSQIDNQNVGDLCGRPLSVGIHSEERHFILCNAGMFCRHTNTYPTLR